MKRDFQKRVWTLGLAILLASCVMGHKKVDYPLIETFNMQTFDIACVELADTATVLTVSVDARFAYHNRICIGSGSYIQADGIKYRLTGAKGITPDSLFNLPESGNATFTFLFEPLPEDTESFDFIGLSHEGDIRLYGIDLTGKQSFDVPEGVPAELLKVDRETSVPDPVFKTGMTTLRIHFLYYRPELWKSVNLYVNTIFGEQQSYENIPIDSVTATATLSFLQCGTVNTSMALGYMSGIVGVYSAPGEEVDVYVDLRLFGYFLLQRRHEEDWCGKPSPFQYVYASGTYANLNAVENVLGSDFPSFNMPLYSDSFADYRMTSAEYAAHVAETYKALADSIERSNLPSLEKEMAQLTLRQQAFQAMSESDRMRLNNYHTVHDSWDMPATALVPMEPEDAKIICTLFDLNDPKLLMGRDMLYYTGGLCRNRKFDWAALAGIGQGLVKDLGEVAGFPGKAAKIALTDSDFARLKAMEKPFYLEAFTRMQDEAKAKLAAAEANARVMDTPDVPDEQLFDALIAPYRGKVVLVDFWNTWCAPCRASIKAAEPLKSGELKSDSLVWLYIADESSPLVTYKQMVSEIQGVHYRLTKAQCDYVCDKFGIRAIPSYVLVDKAGKYGLRNDLRDHWTMRRVLRDELEK